MPLKYPTQILFKIVFNQVNSFMQVGNLQFAIAIEYERFCFKKQWIIKNELTKFLKNLTTLINLIKINLN